jgi:hypothetical protein
MTLNAHDPNPIEIKVVRSDALTGDDREMIHGLFDLTYRQANHAYLDKSLSVLKYIALATADGKPAGFAVADTVEARLPRLPDPEIVLLAGICCISPEFRRMGLFTQLEILAADAGGLLKPGIRILMCGRMAHPVSFRSINKSPAVIPKYGVPLTDWHREIGLRVAELYGVSVDPETLVVHGNGQPIGYPVLEYHVDEAEWLLFKNVNRDRGDSLLGITWYPEAPEGW